MPQSLLGIVYRAVCTNSEFEIGLPAIKNAFRSTAEFEESLLEVSSARSGEEYWDRIRKPAQKTKVAGSVTFSAR